MEKSTKHSLDFQRMVNYDIARKILGKDLILPEEIISSCGGEAYTEDQIFSFGQNIPSPERLEWIRNKGFVLMAGPSLEMGLLDFKIPNTYSYSTGCGRYNFSDQFVEKEKVGPRWYVMSKKIIPETISKTWEQQKLIVPKEERISSLVESVWLIKIMRSVRGVSLFENKFIRTSSLNDMGHRIIIGHYDEKGLCLFANWDKIKIESLGNVYVFEQ